MRHRQFFERAVRRGYHHGQLKDALLDAARILVATRGASGFTLAEAAKMVGVTGAAPYRHFADRQALMSELARRGFDMFGQRLAGAWNDGKPDPKTAFQRMGEAYISFAREEPGLYGAMFSDHRAPNSPDAAIASQSFGFLQTAVCAILATYGLGPDAAQPVALEVWALSHGVAMLTLAGHLDTERTGRDARAIVSQGCAGLIEMAVRRAATKGS